MKFSSIANRLGAVACLLASSPVVALTVSYCSKENTAASDTLATSIYQSNGRCQSQCIADYAYAVVQYKSCWCSNYAPAAQASVGDCDSPCPGYPDDLCGNADKGLYGYIALSNVQPSGTSGAAGSTGGATGTSSGSITTTQSAPQTETITVTASNSVPSTLTTSFLSPGSSTSSTSSGDSATTSSPNVSVHTVAGQPVTVTVSNDPAQTSGGSASTGKKSSSLSGGAIAGIVIGCLVGVGAVAAAALWFFFFGRRRNEENEKSPTPESRYDPSTPGTASDTQRQSRGSQMTFMRGFMGSSEPKSATAANNEFLNPNRAYTDNRMKKDAALYPNGGRHSAVSLRDDEDYTRPVLRLTNPD